MDNFINFPNTYSQDSDSSGEYIALFDVWTTEASIKSFLTKQITMLSLFAKRTLKRIIINIYLEEILALQPIIINLVPTDVLPVRYPLDKGKRGFKTKFALTCAADPIAIKGRGYKPVF